MRQNMNSNNGVSILLSKRNAIDLEALNLLAGKSERILCSCSYCEKMGKHRLDYESQLSNSLYLQKEGFLLEEFIYECIELLQMSEKYKLNLENFKIDLKSIFNGDDGYQFLYIPVVNKKTMGNKKFIVKLLAAVKNKDKRITELLKQIKR